MPHEFKIRVNGGETQTISAAHSEYALAVMEAFGVLGLPYPCSVEIWAEHLLPDYGPYRYEIRDFVDQHGSRYVCPAVCNGAPLVENS